MTPNRRAFLAASAAGLGTLLLPPNLRALAGGASTDDPLAGLKLGWTGQLRWANVVDVPRGPGSTADEKLTNAQALVAAKGGGVVYFPAGEYRFKESVKLLDGVVIRGADPGPVKS